MSGIIDEWEGNAGHYVGRGYVHYHHIVSVTTGERHPTKVVWLRHTARTRFDLDGGPHPEAGHSVTPGIDYAFIPNANVPYP